MSQSTNDTIPTTGRIAALTLLPYLLNEIRQLADSFRQLAKKAGDQIKAGRTHLEDAVPMKSSQEFEAFAVNTEKNIKRLTTSFDELKELAIGGTALGSGINTNPEYAPLMIKKISKNTGIQFHETNDKFEISQSMDAFLHASSSLRILATDFTKIANDLKLLNMGPKAGLHEISLPEVQPGSSIMPGKVNPSIEECVHQIAYQVMGFDHTIALSAQSGQLQLNVMGPVIILNLINSIKLLTNCAKMWREKSIDGIKFNHKKITNLFENSLCVATALNPYIGYEVTAALVHQALEKNQTLKSTILEKELISPKDLETILDPHTMTQPHSANQALINQIHANPKFMKFHEEVK